MSLPPLPRPELPSFPAGEPNDRLRVNLRDLLDPIHDLEARLDLLEERELTREESIEQLQEQVGDKQTDDTPTLVNSTGFVLSSVHVTVTDSNKKFATLRFDYTYSDGSMRYEEISMLKDVPTQIRGF